MLKINSSFSKKIPVPGVEMSSQSYHATIEAELPSGLTAQQIQQKIHETFELVRESVEAELHSNENSKGADELPAETPANNGGNKDNGSPASQKQLKFIRNLGTHHGYGSKNLDAIATKQFGVNSLKELTSKQASSLIDQLNVPAVKTGNRRAA